MRSKDRPRRVRVELFKGDPPYDKLPKEARVAYWLLRPDPEKRSGEHWIMTNWRRDEGVKSVERGEGWENGSITLLGHSYEFAQRNWNQYQESLAVLQGHPSNLVIRQKGHRPITIKKLRGQTHAQWQRFLNRFNHRLVYDKQALTEGRWPLPEHWPLPWEKQDT